MPYVRWGEELITCLFDDQAHFFLFPCFLIFHVTILVAICFWHGVNMLLLVVVLDTSLTPAEADMAFWFQLALKFRFLLQKCTHRHCSGNELWCHLVDVLELILPNSYDGPQWGIFFLSRNCKNKKHRILDIHLKNIYARFGCSESRNKNFKTRGILHIKSI